MILETLPGYSFLRSFQSRMESLALNHSRSLRWHLPMIRRKIRPLRLSRAWICNSWPLLLAWCRCSSPRQLLSTARLRNHKWLGYLWGWGYFCVLEGATSLPTHKRIQHLIQVLLLFCRLTMTEISKLINDIPGSWKFVLRNPHPEIVTRMCLKWLDY